MTFAALVFFSTLAGAEEIKITGPMLCCKACAKAAEEALKSDDFRDVKVDREARTITLKTDAADRALQALQEAGFFGRIEGKEPPAEPSDDPPAKSFNLTKAHLCCAACQRAMVSAIRKVPGVAVVEIEDGVTTVTAGPTGVRPSSVLRAVHEAGLHATVGEIQR